MRNLTCDTKIPDLVCRPIFRVGSSTTWVCLRTTYVELQEILYPERSRTSAVFGIEFLGPFLGRSRKRAQLGNIRFTVRYHAFFGSSRKSITGVASKCHNFNMHKDHAKKFTLCIIQLDFLCSLYFLYFTKKPWNSLSSNPATWWSWSTSMILRIIFLQITSGYSLRVYRTSFPTAKNVSVLVVGILSQRPWKGGRSSKVPDLKGPKLRRVFFFTLEKCFCVSSGRCCGPHLSFQSHRTSFRTQKKHAS